MDRQQVIAKIKAMLELQEATDFEGEAAAAAKLIDKLCAQYGVTMEEVNKTAILDEIYIKGLKLSVAESVLLNAVATFYDASAYVQSYRRGEKTLRVVGSEAQQIQVQLYYEFLKGVMDKECDTAHKGEKVYAELTGRTISKGFRANFKKAFAAKVSLRLEEMKEAEGRIHKDAEAVQEALVPLKLKASRRRNGTYGEGAWAGYDAGSTVSLNKQANGSEGRLALAGA